MWTSNTPAPGCMCAFFMSVVLVAPQPISVRVLNQMTSHSIRFNACSLHVTSWPDDFHFQSFQIGMPKQKAESELPGSKSCPKATRQNFQEEYNYMYIVTVPKGVHENRTMGGKIMLLVD